MRTTIELPDPLFRQLKARAALEGRKLQELIAEYVELGMARRSPSSSSVSRSAPPIFVAAVEPGRTLPFRTYAELEELLLQEEIERCGISLT